MLSAVLFATTTTESKTYPWQIEQLFVLTASFMQLKQRTPEGAVLAVLAGRGRAGWAAFAFIRAILDDMVRLRVS